MEDTNNPASNVARAIAAALDWNSAPEARKAAVSYLESVLIFFFFYGLCYMYKYNLVLLVYMYML